MEDNNLVLTSQTEIIDAECDVYLRQDGITVQIPGNVLRRIITELDAKVNRVEETYNRLHK